MANVFETSSEVVELVGMANWSFPHEDSEEYTMGKRDSGSSSDGKGGDGNRPQGGSHGKGDDTKGNSGDGQKR